MRREDLDVLAVELDALLGTGRTRRDVPLAGLTTFKVGGPADLLVEPRSSDEIVAVLEAAADHDVPVTLLGGGSNALIADAGVRGLVVRPRGGLIAVDAPARVRADAAVTINELVRWTIARGLAGLEAWAGTPGTVGGGIYGNAHWGGRLLGDLVEDVRLWSCERGSFVLPASGMRFGYDRSRLQGTGEVLLSARFRVGDGDPAALRAAARESLHYRKRTQPLQLPSAGCIFQNPGPHAPWPDGVPRSAGAIVDRAGLKGAREGGALVSPVHANFIVNDKRATADEIRALIERCRAVVRQRFGVELQDEIVYLGEFGPGAEEQGVHTAD